MFKKVLRTIYISLPLTFKIYARDLVLYLKATLQGAKSIHSLALEKRFDEVCVLGNGPSLRKDRHVIRKLSKKKDFVCVNNFCDDELYQELKPKLYVFLDAYFFTEKVHPDWVVRRDKTFSTIDKETGWAMTIVVPSVADVSILKKSIKNKNIKIIKINTQPYRADKYSKKIGVLFNSGVYGPPQINVLIYAIYLTIILKYKKIHIFGADLSFHNDVNVDQCNNDLFIKFRHFNEEDKVELLRKNPDKINKWKMGELLDLSAQTFYAHEVMYGYAESKGIEIFNCSDFSLIDAYPRKNLK